MLLEAKNMPNTIAERVESLDWTRLHSSLDEQGYAFWNRPVTGTRGIYQTTLRPRVSTITSGTRLGLGIIFHDAL